MATVTQIAKASLNQINILSSAAPIEPEQMEDFIFAMNNYMLALDASGITLGYTLVSSADDVVTVPTGALLGVIYNMAIVSAGDYDAVPSTDVISMARLGFISMQKLGQRIGRMYLPSTLPLGSGNEHDTGYSTWTHFYPALEAEILAETTGSISLETNTADAET